MSTRSARRAAQRNEAKVNAEAAPPGDQETVAAVCTVCDAPVQIAAGDKPAMAEWTKKGRAFCSDAHAAAWAKSNARDIATKEAALAATCRKLDRMAEILDQKVHLFMDLAALGVTQKRIGDLADMSDVGVINAIKRHAAAQEEYHGCAICNAAESSENGLAESIG